MEAVLPTLGTFVDDTPKEFDSFEDILGLSPNNPLITEIRKKILREFLRSILPNGSHDPLKTPLPHVIKSGNPIFLESFYVNPVPELEKDLPWLRLNLGTKPNVLKKAPKFKFGWRTNKGFARETLAVVNPVIIKRLTVSVLASFGLAKYTLPPYIN
ncbi:putative linoleate 9S-lipoxygenase 4 [Zea mays]|jgi:linoleate 9S-lipoxygenase|uniref:Putative linoleate 9S-lipoxygenase 4 n=1 Tax=Zea mays TaxID=4577 RepID=A0A3L6EKA1_MAIZE|nr:putative linoleate 9S-lipoxygenase 4 [Zea mays]